MSVWSRQLGRGSHDTLEVVGSSHRQVSENISNKKHSRNQILSLCAPLVLCSLSGQSLKRAQKMLIIKFLIVNCF
jgi:hypothetical protein